MFVIISIEMTTSIGYIEDSSPFYVIIILFIWIYNAMLKKEVKIIHLVGLIKIPSGTCELRKGFFFFDLYLKFFVLKYCACVPSSDLYRRSPAQMFSLIREGKYIHTSEGDRIDWNDKGAQIGFYFRLTHHMPVHLRLR